MTLGISPTVIVLDLESLKTAVREVVREELALAQHQQEPDRLLNAKEASELLGLKSVNAFRIAVSRGKYADAVVRNGRSVRFKKSALLEAWRPAGGAA
jgi:hypothetical protein